MFRNFTLVLLLATFPLSAAENVSAFGPVARANISAVGSVAIANVAAIGAVDNTGGGTPFNPATISGYTLDYDVQALGLSDGVEITSLTDQSANKFNLMSADGPYWTNDAAIFNGKGAAFFDSSTAWLQTNFSSTLSQPTTIFVVGTYQAYASVVAFMFDGGSAGDGRNAYYNNTTMHAGSDFPVTAPLASVPYVYEFHFNGANSQGFTNGVALGAAGNSGAQGLHGFTLGTRFGGDPITYGWEGHIARVIVYDADVSGTDLTNLRNYLATNYTVYTP